MTPWLMIDRDYTQPANPAGSYPLGKIASLT
jgi:hypothetical protein